MKDNCRFVAMAWKYLFTYIDPCCWRSQFAGKHHRLRQSAKHLKMTNAAMAFETATTQQFNLSSFVIATSESSKNTSCTANISRMNIFGSESGHMCSVYHSSLPETCTQSVENYINIFFNIWNKPNWKELGRCSVNCVRMFEETR